MVQQEYHNARELTVCGHTIPWHLQTKQYQENMHGTTVVVSHTVVHVRTKKKALLRLCIDRLQPPRRGVGQSVLRKAYLVIFKPQTTQIQAGDGAACQQSTRRTDHLQIDHIQIIFYEGAVQYLYSTDPSLETRSTVDYADFMAPTRHCEPDHMGQGAIFPEKSR